MMGALSSWLIHFIRSGIPPGGAKLAALDPVCAMRVDPATAESYLYHGKLYHFCSRHCLAAFRADPLKYADKDTSAAHPAAHA